MKRIIRIVTNKYLLALAAFGIIYFSQTDWETLQQGQRELKSVKENIAYLNAEIARMNKERTDLKNDPASLEKFAREQYHMKHEGEDVYVIER